MEETKKCPYCGEDIKKEAIYCRYCKSKLDKIVKANDFINVINKNNIEALIDYSKNNLKINNIINEWTPLNWASKELNIEAVKVLLGNGADINLKSKFGYTPLIWAVYKGDLELTKLLLSYNANINVISEEDKTALDYAKKRDNKKIISLLIEPNRENDNILSDTKPDEKKDTDDFKVEGKKSTPKTIKTIANSPIVNKDIKRCPYCSEEIKKEAVFCRHCKSKLSESTMSTITERIDHLDVSEKWKDRFRTIYKAEPLLPKTFFVKYKYPISRKFKENLFAFFFGPFYYLTLGMWKKSITIFAVMTILTLINLSLNIPVQISSLALGAMLAYLVNYDYYRFKVLEENDFWW